MTSITADVQVPTRSRNFSQDDARAVLDLFNGRSIVKDDEGNPVVDDNGNPTYEEVTPAKNVGFGEYNTQGAARSSAVTLNRLLLEVGAPHRFAATTFEREGKYVGVLLNKPAKGTEVPAEEAPAAEAPAEAPADDTPAPARRRRRS